MSNYASYTLRLSNKKNKIIIKKSIIKDNNLQDGDVFLISKNNGNFLLRLHKNDNWGSKIKD